MNNVNEREALEYLVSLGAPEILDIEGYKYSNKQLFRVDEPSPDALKATTLSAMVEYIKSGMDDKCSDQLLIHIISPTKVALLSELRFDKSRETYMICDAMLPNNIVFNNFLDTEKFNIMMQSSFIDTDDKEAILKVTGSIQDGEVSTYGDDGVSQTVTIKTGPAKVGTALVPNPAILAPYRSFSEIKQPDSKFIFRMKSGPTAALFEADGGAWRCEVMNSIAEYFSGELAEYGNIKIIY